MVPVFKSEGGPLSGVEFGKAVSRDPVVPLLAGGAIRSGSILGEPVCGVPGGMEGTGAGVEDGPAAGLDTGGEAVCAKALQGRASMARTRIGRMDVPPFAPNAGAGTLVATAAPVQPGGPPIAAR